MTELKFGVGDLLTMKKPHPCGSREMRVVRTGSDIRVVCCGCGRDVTVPRIKLEKNIKGVTRVESPVE